MKKVLVSIIMASLMSASSLHSNTVVKAEEGTATTDVTPDTTITEEVEIIGVSYEYDPLFTEDVAPVQESVADTALTKIATPDDTFTVETSEIDVTGSVVVKAASGETVIINDATSNIVVYRGEEVYVYDINACTMA